MYGNCAVIRRLPIPFNRVNVYNYDITYNVERYALSESYMNALLFAMDINTYMLFLRIPLTMYPSNILTKPKDIH